MIRDQSLLLHRQHPTVEGRGVVSFSDNAWVESSFSLSRKQQRSSMVLGDSREGFCDNAWVQSRSAGSSSGR